MYLITLSLQKAISSQKQRENRNEIAQVYSSTDNQELFTGSSLFDFLNRGWNIVVFKVGSMAHFLQSYFLVGQQDESPAQQQDATDLFFSGNAIQKGEAVRLIFTDIEEPFYTFLLVSFFWCLLACIPVIVYHSWCFVQPAIFAYQSRRARVDLLTGLFFMYLTLWVVDQFLLPRVFSFFYSFEIDRTGLMLYAETRIYSYVSLYVFINSIVLALFVSTSVWRLSRKKQILNSVRALPCFEITDLSFSLPREWRSYLRESFAEYDGLSTQYQNQRHKIWWGCLLVSAFLSPPELSSQLVCACVLIVCAELAIWLAYISVCRISRQISDLSLY